MGKGISIVVPCYNEEESLTDICNRLKGALLEGGINYEIIFVDDGSTDGTLIILKELAVKNSNIKFISLSRNFGQQIAIMAGIDCSLRNAVVIIDADLQDPPELIPEMVKKWQEGFDIVYAIRESREGETFFKRITAKLFYRIIRLLSGLNLPLDAGDFRLIDKKIADALKNIRIKNTYVRGLVSWVGYRQAGVYYRRDKRLKGKTKYSLKKMIKFSVDAITIFSVIPLRLASLLGLLAAIAGIVYIFHTMYLKFVLNIAIPGWSSLMVAILFLGSVQLISLGIIGEYLGRVYDESRHMPLYLVKEKSTF